MVVTPLPRIDPVKRATASKKDDFVCTEILAGFATGHALLWTLSLLIGLRAPGQIRRRLIPSLVLFVSMSGSSTRRVQPPVLRQFVSCVCPPDSFWLSSLDRNRQAKVLLAGLPGPRDCLYYAVQCCDEYLLPLQLQVKHALLAFIVNCCAVTPAQPLAPSQPERPFTSIVIGEATHSLPVSRIGMPRTLRT